MHGDVGDEMLVLGPHVERRLFGRYHVRLDLPGGLGIAPVEHEGEVGGGAQARQGAVAGPAAVLAQPLPDRRAGGNPDVGHLLGAPGLVEDLVHPETIGRMGGNGRFRKGVFPLPHAEVVVLIQFEHKTYSNINAGIGLSSIVYTTLLLLDKRIICCFSII